MELKFGTSILTNVPTILLIEPCGIEILKAIMKMRKIKSLLIEPCGIEIRQSVGFGLSAIDLLIEPCGIEIWYFYSY